MRKLIPLMALAATAARAENGFFYLGAGVTRSSVSDLSDFGVRRTDLGNPGPRVMNRAADASLERARLAGDC
jgi:hypothetical protein